jgi:hypothetical protein
VAIVSDENDMRRAADALDRIADFLVEDILASSDEDIASEAADDNEDVARLAAEMKSLFPPSVLELYVQHVSRSGENVIPFPLPPPPAQRREATAVVQAPVQPDRETIAVPARRFTARSVALFVVMAAAAGALGEKLWSYHEGMSSALSTVSSAKPGHSPPESSPRYSALSHHPSVPR